MAAANTVPIIVKVLELFMGHLLINRVARTMRSYRSNWVGFALRL